MAIALLPPCNFKRAWRLIRRTHPSDKEDAMQEAWLAHLQGDDPCRGIDRFRDKERRRQKRRASILSGRYGEFAVDSNGSTHNLDN